MSDCPRNFLQHSFEILKHLDVPKSQHAEATCLQKRSASRVGCGLVNVLSTVKLHHEPLLTAAEVGDLIADGELAVKLGVEKSVGAQLRPEPGFRFGLFAPQPAGTLVHNRNCAPGFACGSQSTLSLTLSLVKERD